MDANFHFQHGSMLPSMRSTTRGRPVCLAYKRMRQTLERKHLQKLQQKQFEEALSKNLSESLDTNVVEFKLSASTPSSQAYQDYLARVARVNADVQSSLETTSTWTDLDSIVNDYGDDLNYQTFSAVVMKLGLLVSSGRGPYQPDSTSPSHQQPSLTQTEEEAQYDALVNTLLSLLVQRTSWFSSEQYAQVSYGMAACGHSDPVFWGLLTASAERKMLSCTGHQLALLATGIAWSGFTPNPQWCTKTEIQAAKHWHVTTVSDACALLWSWARWSYTPSKPFMSRVTRRMAILTHRKLLNGQQLLQVLYFMSRLSKHHPPLAFLNDWCTAFQPYLHQTPPGVLADVLLCLASLQYNPRPAFARDLLQYMVMGTDHASYNDTMITAMSQSHNDQLGVRGLAQQQLGAQTQQASLSETEFNTSERNQSLATSPGYKPLEAMLGSDDPGGVDAFNKYEQQQLQAAYDGNVRSVQEVSKQAGDALSLGDEAHDDDDDEDYGFLLDDEQGTSSGDADEVQNSIEQGNMGGRRAQQQGMTTRQKRDRINSELMQGQGGPEGTTGLEPSINKRSNANLKVSPTNLLESEVNIDDNDEEESFLLEDPTDQAEGSANDTSALVQPDRQQHRRAGKAMRTRQTKQNEPVYQVEDDEDIFLLDSDDDSHGSGAHVEQSPVKSTINQSSQGLSEHQTTQQYRVETPRAENVTGHSSNSAVDVPSRAVSAGLEQVSQQVDGNEQQQGTQQIEEPALLTQGAAVVLMKPAGMVPDLALCGPISDTRWPVERAHGVLRRSRPQRIRPGTRSATNVNTPPVQSHGTRNSKGDRQHDDHDDDHDDDQHESVQGSDLIQESDTIRQQRKLPTYKEGRRVDRSPALKQLRARLRNKDGASDAAEHLVGNTDQEEEIAEYSSVGSGVTDMGLAPGLQRNHSTVLQARHLGAVAWSVASMRLDLQQDWLDEYVDTVLLCLDDLPPPTLADILYGLSSVAKVRRPAVSRVQTSPSSNSDGNALAAGQASLASSPVPVQAAVLASRAVVTDNAPSGMAMLLPPITQPASESVKVARTDADSAAPPRWALPVSLGVTVSEEAVMKVSSALAGKMGGMEPDAVMQSVVALARWSVHPGDDWIQEVLSSTHDRLHTFSCWALPDLVVGLVQLGAQPHYTWWDKLEAAALPLLEHCPASHVSRLSWGLAAARHRPSPQWLHELLVAALATFKRMDERELATLIWSFARLRHRPGMRWLDAYCVETSSRMAAGLLQHCRLLADLSWGLAAVGYKPTPEWLLQFEGALEASLASAQPQQLAVVLWAFTQWRYVPTRQSLLQHLINLKELQAVA